MSTKTKNDQEAALFSQVAKNVTSVSIPQYLHTKQHEYMLYTITSRAIPTAADGVKLGARRLFYSMYNSRMFPGTDSFKALAAVTDAMKFHPHGDSSMYDTLVTWAVEYGRVQVAEPIGAYGRKPGDLPSAPRYTETLLTPIGMEVVRDLADNVVDMRPTYDSKEVEPAYLPSRLPLYLMAGSEGIAEAYATSTPAHNPRELLDLTRALLKNPDMSTDEMLEIMPGPDWGTGGEVIGGSKGIRSYFDTGKGHMTVRGRMALEGKNVIVISEMPPGESARTLHEVLLKKSREKIIPGVVDVREQSGAENPLRIEVVVKRGQDPQETMDWIWRETSMQKTYSASLVALQRDLVPRWWTVREAILEFLDMRDDVVLRRSQSQLVKVREKLLQAEALEIISLDKQRAADVILAAKDRSSAAVDIADAFPALVEGQPEYVVGLPLYRLTKADALQAQQAAKELRKQAGTLEKLVASKLARAREIDRELAQSREMFASATYDRRTRLSLDVDPISSRADSDEVEGLTRWKLDADMGTVGEHGEPIAEGEVVWAAYSDGRMKLFAGGGLPKRITTRTISPDVSELVGCGTVVPGTKSMILVTYLGRVIRIDMDTDKIKPQGVAGNGVAGIRLAEDDRVIYAGVHSDSEHVLTVSSAAWKVVEVGTIPVKGRGGQGVRLHNLRKDDEGLVAVEAANGFEVNGDRAVPMTMSKVTVKSDSVSWNACE